jgi:hypothetical protein
VLDFGAQASQLLSGRISKSTDEASAVASGPASTEHHPWHVEIFVEDSKTRRDVEHAILARGVALPFASRTAVLALPEFASSAFFAVRGHQGDYVGGFAVQSRPAPLGHRLVRVEQFGRSFPPEADGTVVSALRHWVRGDPRVLRLSVDVFSFDEERRRSLGETLREHGFRQAEHPNGYVETLLLDLSPGEHELLGALHYSARRKIRQVDRNPVALRRVTDASFADRMNALLEETLSRTGGQFRRGHWPSRIDLSRAHPELSNVVGLFRTDVTGPESLLAFAWGCHGGDHVFYSDAASTRDTGSLRMPLAYGIMWELILWAKRTGARWFDFGGITHGTSADDDPLGGISDFKRSFCQRVVKVRDEWILDDHSWRASLAGAIHRRLRGG